MKTTKLIILLAGMLFITTAYADKLPSDEEMMAIGRQKLGDFGAVLDKAQQSLHVQPAKPVNVPQNTQVRSPIEKALIEETMAEAPNIGKVKERAKGSDLIVFVSFSMPDDVLKSYSEQAREAGATIALRGMAENSIEKTKLKAYAVSRARSAWEINPSLFKKFKIERVPAIVLARGDDKTTENGCAIPTSYLRVDGEVAIRQALLLMRQYGEKPLANDAAARLEKLEKRL